MKWWLIILTILFVFVQTTVTEFNLLLFMVLVLALSGLGNQAMLIGFFGGLLVDLAGQTAIGVTSISILVPVYLVTLYQRKFSSGNILFWLVIFSASIYVSDAVKGRLNRWQDILIVILLVLPTFFILNRLSLLGWAQDDEGIRLKG